MSGLESFWCKGSPDCGATIDGEPYDHEPEGFLTARSLHWHVHEECRTAALAAADPRPIINNIPLHPCDCDECRHDPDGPLMIPRQGLHADGVRFPPELEALS